MNELLFVIMGSTWAGPATVTVSPFSRPISLALYTYVVATSNDQGGGLDGDCVAGSGWLVT